MVLNHDTGEYVPMVWDPKENDWVPPQIKPEQPDLGGDLGQEERRLTGKDMTKEPDFGEPIPKTEELPSDWEDTWGGGESQVDVPIGWSTDQYFAYAPDGTKFDLYDPASMWDYDDELQAAAAAEQKAADAADDTEAKKAARKAAREAARDATKAADDAAAAQKAADDAAAQKAADDAAAAQKAADDAAAAAAQKAADEAAAAAASQKAADAAAAGVWSIQVQVLCTPRTYLPPPKDPNSGISPREYR